MDIELLITAFFNRIRHSGGSIAVHGSEKNQCRWYINDLGIRKDLEGIIQEIYT